MRKILLHNWREKLACLLLGAALWYLIHQDLAQPPGQTQRHAAKPDPAASPVKKSPKLTR